MIACAPNGARRTNLDHGLLPTTPAELTTAAEPLPEAGVSLLHLHVRNAEGRHSLDPDSYRNAITAIRDRIGERLVIQITTEAVGIYSPPEQMDVVRQLQAGQQPVFHVHLAAGPIDGNTLRAQRIQFREQECDDGRSRAGRLEQVSGKDDTIDLFATG